MNIEPVPDPQHRARVICFLDDAPSPPHAAKEFFIIAPPTLLLHRAIRHGRFQLRFAPRVLTKGITVGSHYAPIYYGRYTTDSSVLTVVTSSRSSSSKPGACPAPDRTPLSAATRPCDTRATQPRCKHARYIKGVPSSYTPSIPA